MKNIKKNSFNFTFNRFIILVNILIFLFFITISYIFHTHLEKYQLPKDIGYNLHEINMLSIFLGSLMVVVNTSLYILLRVYSSKKYFKIMSTINFESLDEAVNLIDKSKSIDEVGYLGTQINKILKIYIDYAFLYKTRLSFEQLKSFKYLELLSKGVILLQRNHQKSDWIIKHFNDIGRDLILKPSEGESKPDQNNSSLLIEKPFHTILHKQSYTKFLDVLKNKVSMTPLAIDSIKPIPLKLNFLLESSDDENNLQASLYPFIYEFPDSYQLRDKEQFPSNQNIRIDSIILIFESLKSDESPNPPKKKTSSKKTSHTKI